MRPEWDNWWDKNYYWVLGLLFKDYPLYSQEHEKDPLVIAKLFDPTGSATWFLLEYDPIEKIAFGYVQGLIKDEFGYISFTEMESLKVVNPPTIQLQDVWYFLTTWWQKLFFRFG